MYKLFEKESFVAYLIYVLLLGLLAVQIVLNSPFDNTNVDSFLLGYVFHLDFASSYLSKAFLFLVVLLTSFLNYRLLRETSFYSKSSTLFLSIITINLIVAFIYPYTFSNIVFLLYFSLCANFLYRSHSQGTTVSLYFKLGFWTGIASLIVLESIFLIPALIFSVFVYGDYGLRDFVSLIFGILVSWFIGASFLLFADKLELMYSFFGNIRNIDYDFLTGYEWIILVILLVSSVFAIPIVPNANIRTRKLYTFLLFVFLTVVPLYVFLSIGEIKMNLVLMVLASYYFIPYYMQIRGAKMKGFLLFSGIVMAIIATFVPIKF